ncbi:serine hydrolase [Crossiella sp. CA-258035]|uniref:serine hydrolase domain-containing protein n=1 Tax=Crossiella sp. CA-258035 TaxID=2981138 RepID=UPI0024BBF78D|nr:serine hydrolase domain-containing protein [Crossiella sp. CA-258035]WHT17851.1 serine hydrolase [Crossiella sp. CA-258035]
MTARLLLLATTATLISALLPIPAAAAADPARIDTVVRDYLAATGLPGAAVTITHRDRVLHAAGYGHTATGDPVTEHTPMPVASVSKSFTALAVAQLAETGRVGLDRPVRAYLPEFTMADPRVESITVRQLLDQTSGLSDRTFPSFTRPQPNTLAESVASMRSARLAADPGTHWEYHNPNFQVAARLVEVVSGQDFNSYLRSHILTPLGMTTTRTLNTAKDLPSPSGHLLVLGLPVALPEPPAFGNGSGGMLSTAHDLAAWLIAQNNNGRGPTGAQIATPATITATHTPSPASGDYALGWSLGRTDSGAPLIAHSGDLFTATAYQALLPSTGHGIAVLANTGMTHADAPALARRLITLLENRPLPAPATPLLLTDAILLALTLATTLLTIQGLRRAHRWTQARTTPRPTRRRLRTPGRTNEPTTADGQTSADSNPPTAHRETPADSNPPLSHPEAPADSNPLTAHRETPAHIGPSAGYREASTDRNPPASHRKASADVSPPTARRGTPAHIGPPIGHREASAARDSLTAHREAPADASPPPAHRQASARATGARIALRLLPYLLPLVLLLTVHRIVGLLFRGRDVAWLQVVYLYPTFMLFLATATLGCLLVVLARVTALARPRTPR